MGTVGQAQAAAHVRIVAAAALALFALGVAWRIESRSSAALIAATCLWYLLVRSSLSTRVKRITVVVVTVLGAAAVGVMVVAERAARLPFGFLTIRYALWSTALRALAERPLLGWGADGFFSGGASVTGIDAGFGGIPLVFADGTTDPHSLPVFVGRLLRAGRTCVAAGPRGDARPPHDHAPQIARTIRPGERRRGRRPDLASHHAADARGPSDARSDAWSVSGVAGAFSSVGGCSSGSDVGSDAHMGATDGVRDCGCGAGGACHRRDQHRAPRAGRLLQSGVLRCGVAHLQHCSRSTRTSRIKPMRHSRRYRRRNR